MQELIRCKTAASSSSKYKGRSIGFVADAACFADQSGDITSVHMRRDGPLIRLRLRNDGSRGSFTEASELRPDIDKGRVGIRSGGE